MGWTLVLVLLALLRPSLSELFTVEAERPAYEAEFGGDVVMSCRFEPVPEKFSGKLQVTWHWIASDTVREVYRRDKGQEILDSQHPHYRGRTKLLTEKLDKGLASLQVSGLRINDSGTYQCFVQTSQGADYKSITLSVRAPYKNVSKDIEKKAADGQMLLLICRSEGFPESSVEWHDGRLKKINSNTTAVSLPDQRYQVSSQILVPSSDKNNYTCNFSEGHSTTFHIPEDVQACHAKSDAVIVILGLGVTLLAIIAIVVVFRRKKGVFTEFIRNVLLHVRGTSESASLQVKKENEEETTILNDASTEENLEASVKAVYSSVYGADGVRCHSDGLCLQNKLGEPENLQALLPQAGETLILHGAPGHGTSPAARLLISSWMLGPGSDVLDLSAVRFVLRVDCGKAEADLFEEITTQLNLRDSRAGAELRTTLSGSEDVLLLLDGYREGNWLFNESLKTFLSERRRCRVLVTTCPGQSLTVGSGQVRELQTQAEKS